MIFDEVIIEELFNKPVLQVYGNESDFIETKDIQLLRNVFPQFIYHNIEGSLYWVHVDAEDKLFESIVFFIDS